MATREAIRHNHARQSFRALRLQAATCLAGMVLFTFSVNVCFAGESPAFHADPDHGGVADEVLQLPLNLAWTYRSNQLPRPAFRGGLAPSKNRVESITYDYVFEPVVADGHLLFGSSSEDAVFCLDCDSGEARWTFHTEGPIRFAPRVLDGRVYSGSDDGYVYCLESSSGSLLWKLQAAPSDQRCIGNGRVISAWPVRTSVAIVDKSVYFGSGLFPTTGAYLCAVDAETGGLLWRRFVPYSLHGQVLVDGDNLVVATGRTAPAEFRRLDGQPLAEEPSPRRALGGSFVGKLNDILVWGPDESGVMFLRVSPDPIADRRRQDRGTTLEGHITGLHARCLVASNRLYLVRQEQILAVDWELFCQAASENPKVKWRRWEKSSYPRYGSRPFGLGRAGLLNSEDHLLFEQVENAKQWSIPNESQLTNAILAGDMVILGGKDTVVLLDAATGNRLSALEVQGEARGLAVADGSLFVSTDRGNLYCFRNAMIDLPRRTDPEIIEPPSSDQHVRAVETILRQTDTQQGFCLVLGAGNGSLAAEMARQSEFSVVVVDSDASKVASVRDELTRTGLYGKRVVVHHITDEHPAYPACFANLIVSDAILQSDRLPYRPAAVLRLLQPYGGTIALHSTAGMVLPVDWQLDGLSGWMSTTDNTDGAWQIARRGTLPGAGKWTQMYANPANTVCSEDNLVGRDSVMQWFGPPGAEDVVERHAVAMPPLFHNGKLFVAGLLNSVRAVDAYNGTRIWRTTVPESTRMMLSHSAGFMAAGDSALFVAADSNCWMLDADAGALLHKYETVNSENDWGYVGVVGDYLLGSDQKKPADEYSSGTRKEGYRFLTSARDLHSRPTVSEALFAFDYRTQRRVWAYEDASVILNSTITIGADRVVFVESRAREVVADETGTAWLPDFFAQGARLVAIDLTDGSEVWSQSLGPLSTERRDEHEHIVFLSYSDGSLLLARTGHIDQKLSYRLEGRDATTGNMKWQQTISSRHRVYAPLTYGKNGQQSHPSIVNGTAFLLSHITDALIALDLKTGEIVRDEALFDFWIHSKTCAVPTASATGLYFRRDSCYLFDLPSRQAIDLTAVTRPGCWMSIIPAGGLILMPEASSGCTCGFALQTSVVLAPAH